ncbi:hypothetical protein I6F07_17340 [Ensifer sp. IC4062]|nr:hypothetical protein [Ensifer sp. IC4062]MCA1441946.1 hypothetical protein [Ensifer sp. IC4062]
MTVFRTSMIDKRVLYPLGVQGLYGRSDLFEGVVEGIDARLKDWARAMEAEAVHFPPEMTSQTLASSGYYKSFPQLIAGVHTFCDCADEAPKTLSDWQTKSSPSEFMLTPAACYPVYPLVKARGQVPAGGALLTVMSYCFRAEASNDLHRQQSFRMREFVRIGSPAEVEEFRRTWYSKAADFLAELGLTGTREVANDPFFGKEGRILKINQRVDELKYEMLVPVDVDQEAACISFNNHLDAMARKWDLQSTDAESQIHSGCVAFGLERLALAVFLRHGLSAAEWPDELRTFLRW